MYVCMYVDMYARRKERQPGENIYIYVCIVPEYVHKGDKGGGILFLHLPGVRREPGCDDTAANTRPVAKPGSEVRHRRRTAQTPPASRSALRGTEYIHILMYNDTTPRRTAPHDSILLRVVM